MIKQRSGFFTHALNLGKKNATGDLLLYTDDDAIPVKRSRLQEILREYYNGDLR